MPDSRFVKRLQKKARKGMRGWPLATIAFYGPNLSQATKVAVGIIPSENADVSQMRALSVAMSDGIMGCPHQEGIDYEGEWCPVCEFWRGRDRFTGKMLQ
jgi:hypothetical protein